MSSDSESERGARGDDVMEDSDGSGGGGGGGQPAADDDSYYIIPQACRVVLEARGGLLSCGRRFLRLEFKGCSCRVGGCRGAGCSCRA